MVRANCVFTTGLLVSVANENTASQFPTILQSLYQNCLAREGPDYVSGRFKPSATGNCSATSE